ncbi:MAG: zinc ribbon domain-containing protein, partial [Deltaproteobacteria bacterium]
MKCPECRFDNRKGVKFCEECGAKLEFECPRCKAKIPPDRKFCGECGHRLTEPFAAPAVDFSEPQSSTPKCLADKILMDEIHRYEGTINQFTG